MFRNVAELVGMAEKDNIKIAEVMIRQEVEVSGRSREEVIAQMDHHLSVMERAVERGLEGVVSRSGLTGGDAVRMQRYIEGRPFFVWGRRFWTPSAKPWRPTK